MPLRTCLLCIICVFCTTLLLAQETTDAPSPTVGPLPTPSSAVATMTNDSIIRMVKAGLNDNIILQTISSAPGQYDTTADSLVQLRQAGVSNRVIQAMVEKKRVRLTVSNTPVVVADVNEVGVYYKDRNGVWQPIDSEVVHEVSGGFLKSTATHGLIKQDKNGRLNGHGSKLALPRPVELLIYAPDGVTPDEYTMVRFRLHSDSREFRTWTGGVIHSTGGAKRDEVDISPEKIAPRIYRITLDRDLPPGEYGILPPGTAGVGSLGKAYTFSVSE